MDVGTLAGMYLLGGRKRIAEPDDFPSLHVRPPPWSRSGRFLGSRSDQLSWLLQKITTPWPLVKTQAQTIAERLWKLLKPRAMCISSSHGTHFVTNFLFFVMHKGRKRKWKFVFFGALIRMFFLADDSGCTWHVDQGESKIIIIFDFCGFFFFFSPPKQVCCLKSVLLANHVYLPFSFNTESSRILVKIWHGIYSLVFSVLLSMPSLFGTRRVKIVVFTEMSFLFICQWKKLRLLTLLVIKMQFSLASAVYAVYFYSTASILFWIR